MAGVAWDPIVRIQRANGLPEDIALRSACAYARGPAATAISHDLLQDLREDVNRTLRPRKQGIRTTLKWTFYDGGSMVDSEVLRRIVSAWEEDGTRLYVSYDGGATFREAAISAIKGPEPISGKQFAGVKWELTLQSVDAASSLSSVLTGGW